MHKGDKVFYVSSAGTGDIVQAKVLVAHRGGAAKVEAMRFVYDGGVCGQAYLGDRFELAAHELHASAMGAEIYRAVARALRREAA